MSELEPYILAHIDPEPELLQKIDREAHVKLLHPNMNSGHLQGRLLKMFTQMIRPNRVLEIGTFIGYSTLCFAEGLEEKGEVYTVEIDDEMEDYIRENFAKSGVNHKIKLYVGDALQIVPQFDDESFDLVFIDADKRDYWDYFETSLPKLKKGGFIFADNTLWHGKVLEKVVSNDWQTKGVLKFNEKLANDDRVEKVILPIRDGITLIRKK